VHHFPPQLPQVGRTPGPECQHTKKGGSESGCCALQLQAALQVGQAQLDMRAEKWDEAEERLGAALKLLEGR
jgi:hypothetical protein